MASVHCWELEWPLDGAIKDVTKGAAALVSIFGEGGYAAICARLAAAPHLCR